MQFNETDRQKIFMGRYNPVKDKLWRYIRSMVWQMDDARDIESETILQAFSNMHKLRNENSFLSFLFGIAARLLKQKARRRRLQSLIGAKPINESEFDDPGHNVDAEILYQMLKKLGNKEREAIVLFEISGLSIKEIEALLGDSIGAIKTRLTRGRQKLAKLLNAELPVKEEYDPDIDLQQTLKIPVVNLKLNQ